MLASVMSTTTALRASGLPLLALGAPLGHGGAPSLTRALKRLAALVCLSTCARHHTLPVQAAAVVMAASRSFSLALKIHTSRNGRKMSPSRQSKCSCIASAAKAQVSLLQRRLKYTQQD